VFDGDGARRSAAATGVAERLRSWLMECSLAASRDWRASNQSQRCDFVRRGQARQLYAETRRLESSTESVAFSVPPAGHVMVLLRM